MNPTPRPRPQAPLTQRLAQLPPEARRAYLESLNEQQLLQLAYTWQVWARPEQLTPPGAWLVWLILAGRGWGKTRTGAEDVKAYGLAHPGVRIGVAARIYADARDTCVEGESGLLSVLPPGTVQTWNRTLGELDLINGTRFKLFSAGEPDRLRGPQHHRAWCDELASWEYPEAFDQVLFGLRLGERPQVVVTTTPKPVRLIRELLARRDVLVTRGSTFDNAANISTAVLAQLEARYRGTRLGRQELYAELLEDMEGALWKRDQLDQLRVIQHPEMERIVVAVDPEASSAEGAAETGIVVAGRGRDGHFYVLADVSLRGTPDQWGRAAVAAYHAWGADRLCGEVNNGGEMVGHVIRTVDPTVAFKALHASHGKAARAEPVAALYEQNKAHHVGFFPDLEDQLCGWVAGDKSPDRLDALVWAGTELMLSTSYGEIPMAVGGTPIGYRQSGSDAVVDNILKRLADVRDAKEGAEQSEAAGAPEGAEPELTEGQLQHMAGLARMLGNLENWGGPRWG